jgi:hypothetical protein
MSTATLNVVVVSKRMLTMKEAAHYCGRQEKRFRVECPCSPVAFPNGDLRCDLRDLDIWLDNLKGTNHDVDLSRLG